VVGGVGDDGVSEGGLSVCGALYACGGSVYRNVEVAYGVVSFCFRSEM
jgi:hypothetical protein